ncbi:kinesin-like protein [Plakobranchus ocellatus]|uniref:Kinesin-like protein n=1 Tax=Plakobranchus ocellatus TaxID=259542 RepID=A0AAV3YDK9_9GAST|nr:kinesin-like protein [Plakobranchus ocellatus]
MASKEKIKKKRKHGSAAPKIIPEDPGDSNPNSVKETQEIVLHGKDNEAEENQKDTGQEKARSNTPSPPVGEAGPSQEDFVYKKELMASPAYGGKKRSTSPFSQNKVEPLPVASNPGSLVSLKSSSSVKEAWTDNEEDKKRPESHIAIRKQSGSKGSLVSMQSHADVLSVQSAGPEQNAYIPYLYARRCIMQVSGDMKAMKEKHIRLVHDMEAHYRSLEGESQDQFMEFVTKYREKFGTKLDLFRQLMLQHQLETQHKEAALVQQVESLTTRNTLLLEEKNNALAHSKEEIEKMDAEMAAMKTEMAAVTAAQGTEEFSKLQKENMVLKQEIQQLKSSEASSSSNMIVEKEHVPLVAAAVIPASVRDDTNKNWTEQVLKLQEEVTQLKRENVHLTATNQALQARAQESAGLAEKFSALENQYKALSLVVLASPENKDVAQEKLEKTKEDEAMMQEEQKRLSKEISAWEKKFIEENKREPTEEEKPDSVKELYVQREEAEIMLTSLEQQKDTLVQLQSGKVPSAPEATIPEKVAEPEVQLVEVKVPDPEVILALEASQEEVTQLKAELAELSSLAGVAAAGVVAQDDEEKAAVEAALLQERAAHDNTKAELENLQKQLEEVNLSISVERAGLDSKLETLKTMLEAKLAAKEKKIESLQKRNDELEDERMKGVPVDTAKEIKNLQNKVAMLEAEVSTTSLAQAENASQLADLERKVKLGEEALEASKAQQTQLEVRLKTARKEKDDAVRDLTKLLSARGPARPSRQKTQVGDTVSGGRGDIAALKRENQELNAKIKQLERESFSGAAIAGAAGGDRNVQKRHEKILKELEKRYDMERAKTAKLAEHLKNKEEEATGLQKDLNKKEAEVSRLTAEMSALGLAAKEGVTALGKVKSLESENKKLVDENKVLSENYNSERVLRKKYYNMVEDMKGKIRVYCRARPLSNSEKERGNHSVLKSTDEYTMAVNSSRGLKEFQYDQVFMEDSTQEQIFEDTNNLIQSAFDGYNVCIFAYGQTGSGKTFTMIGDSSKKFPGIAPRAFERIFELAEENRGKFKTTVSVYMLELYNDKLIDLFAKPGTSDDEKMEIKKDKKGLVYVHGSIIKPAANAKELGGLFDEGSLNRHVASTKMNAESSRSHLILSVIIESENLSTGNILKGKLSLVDLAGSERVGKTGATAEQLKEAMSINKSLSALGDVIAALSSEQSFIPYRNHKLTMLMQDSLGGNAKTLMFVNVSPADYNVDETVISLTYASRVKLITNDASKNADNKEIHRLKAKFMNGRLEMEMASGLNAGSELEATKIKVL